MPHLWFRLYSEVLSDRKLAHAAQATGVPRATALGTWIGLLCLANDSPEQGRLMLAPGVPLGMPEIAEAIGIAPDALDRLVQQFLALGMLREDANALAIANWDRRFAFLSANPRASWHAAQEPAQAKTAQEQEGEGTIQHAKEMLINQMPTAEQPDAAHRAVCGTEPGQRTSDGGTLADRPGSLNIASDVLAALIAADLTRAELKVLLAIVQRTCESSSGSVVASYGELAKATGITRCSVIRAVNALVAAQVLERQSTGPCSSPSLSLRLPPASWRLPAASVAGDTAVTRDIPVTSDTSVTDAAPREEAVDTPPLPSASCLSFADLEAELRESGNRAATLRRIACRLLPDSEISDDKGPSLPQAPSFQTVGIRRACILA